MRGTLNSLAVVAAATSLVAAIPLDRRHYPGQDYLVSLGPRPYYLVHNVSEGALKDKLVSCENKPVGIQSWSIGHRGGGTLQIPEETVESTLAGARMGAGILECDISFTADRGLVCRHSLCDLHTTTDILLRPELAAKCSKPFTPANKTSPASALCCTSDITTEEFTSLCGKMDGFNASATNVKDYQRGIPTWRTELYDTCAQVLTLPDWIDLVDSIPGHRNFTPELKTPPASVPLPFKGYTQAQYARDAIKAFTDKGIDPSRVYFQSFTPADIYLWLNEFPAFGKQAIYLDEDGDTADNFTVAVNRLGALKASGVNIISPPSITFSPWVALTMTPLCPLPMPLPQRPLVSISLRGHSNDQALSPKWLPVRIITTRHSRQPFTLTDKHITSLTSWLEKSVFWACSRTGLLPSLTMPIVLIYRGLARVCWRHTEGCRGTTGQ